MSPITKNPQATEKKIEAMINQAPDGKKSSPRGRKPTGSKTTSVAITLDNNVLSNLDSLALSNGLSRSSLITMAVMRLVSRGRV